MKIRFAINQVGLNVEYFAHGDWRSAGMFNHDSIKKHGGIANLKTKALYSLYPSCNMQQEVMPAGDYSENGMTITCV
jgi:hypothetical protein